MHFLGSVMLIVLLVFSYLFSAEAIAININHEQSVMSVLGVLLAIALFLERAVDVFLSAWRSEKADLLDSDIAILEEKVKKIDEKLANPSPLVNVGKINQERADLQNKLDTARIDRTKYRIKSRHWAIWGSLIAGLVIAAVGVRVLAALFTFKTGGDPGVQYKLFNMIDVLVTGGLLAGGSAAINELMKLYTGSLQSTRQQIAQKTNT
ncbi:MAG: hypothetical protein HQM06_15115 [Magnetococcales bacterium]|nr:hypothetical protein [Magnetococcales bacterium]